jgi:hypothetical protein
MSVMEIVSQVKTLPFVEQAELFKEIHRLEEEQKLLMQYQDLLEQPIQKQFIEIPEEQADYVLALLEKEGIRLP